MTGSCKFTRHPDSIPGDFYVEDICCISCGVPQEIAPDLVGWVDEKELQCAWKKQPETPEEFDIAIAVLHTQELGYHRYAGSDPAILRRLPTEVCDEPTEAPNVRPNENILTPIPLRLSMPQEKPGLIRSLLEVMKRIMRPPGRIAVTRKRRATCIAHP